MDKVIFLILLISLNSCNQTDKNKNLISVKYNSLKLRAENKAPKHKNQLELIKSDYTDTVLLEFETIEKDWWENIYLARKMGDSIVRIFPEAIPLTSQSILSAKFVNFAENNSVFFEIYEITHQGNGCYNLFEYKKGTLKNILKIRAVDRNQEGLGITGDSSFIFKEDKLKSEYTDLDGDGYLDIKFSGIGYIVSDKKKSNLNNPIELERQFVWDIKSEKFEELVSKRKGFWYYDKYGIEY